MNRVEMRQLASYASESRAKALGDFLAVEGIENSIREARDGSFSVWVHDDGELERARSGLAAFEARPQDDPELSDIARRARELRKETAKRASERPPAVDVRKRWSLPFGIGPLTAALIVVSVLVGLVTRLGNSETVIYFLFALRRGGIGFVPSEPWRLVSPIFVHFGILHLVFNMWWLKDFGSLVERRYSSLYLAALVFVVAVGSNWLEFYLGRSLLFGGMSGVIYGLFGFLWMRGRFDPTAGYEIPNQTVFWLMGWFVICLTGVLGPVANYAHGGGLVVGGAWGFLSAQTPRTRRFR